MKPGERIGTLWVIDDGLKPGERVVAEGAQKVKQGMPVNPQAVRFPSATVLRRLLQNARPASAGEVTTMYRFFIRRPIVAMVIAIITVIIGLVSMAGLPVAQYPNIVPPEILMQATYVGADALTIEQSVATPIEQQMSGVDNMNYMFSLNPNNGLMRMTVNFDVNTDPNTDQVLTQLRESQAETQLPIDVRNYGVTVQKSLSAPLMLFALYSPNGTYDATFLANYAYINIVDQLDAV